MSTRVETPERVLHRLEWQVIRRLDGRLQGNYRTIFRGVGTDFRDLREYEPGDDVRHIDWNVTARMDTPFIRQYTEDRELTAWLLLDRSPSMGFGPIDRPKELVLTELATTFARLLTRGGNPVGAILFDSEVERTIQPRSGRNQVLALTRSLMQPPTARGAITDLAGPLEFALGHGKVDGRSRQPEHDQGDSGGEECKGDVPPPLAPARSGGHEALGRQPRRPPGASSQSPRVGEHEQRHDREEKQHPRGVERHQRRRFRDSTMRTSAGTRSSSVETS